MALFPAELAKQGAQRGQSEADAALLSRTCRSSASSAATTSGPTSRRAALLATSRTLRPRPVRTCVAVAAVLRLSRPSATRHAGNPVSEAKVAGGGVVAMSRTGDRERGATLCLVYGRRGDEVSGFDEAAPCRHADLSRSLGGRVVGSSARTSRRRLGSGFWGRSGRGRSSADRSPRSPIAACQTRRSSPSKPCPRKSTRYSAVPSRSTRRGTGAPAHRTTDRHPR